MKNKRIKTLVAEFFKTNELNGLSPETREYYSRFVGYFVSWLPKKVRRTKQLTRELFNEYALYLTETVPNKTSRRTYLRAVRRLYNYAAMTGATTYTSLTLPKGETRVKATFMDGEVRKILSGDCRKTSDMIAMLLMTTGIRSATLRELRVSDFDSEEKTLLLRRLKNGTVTVLPLDRTVSRKLNKYLEHEGKLEQGERYIFENRYGKPYTKSGLYQTMSDMCERKGFRVKGVHVFRHTYAKLLSRAGCPSITLARCLTHRTVSQSEQYVNLYGNDLRQACERFNPMITMKKRLRGKQSQEKSKE